MTRTTSSGERLSIKGDRTLDPFIADLFGLFNELTRHRASNRLYVIASGRCPLAALQACPAEDECEEILIEAAVPAGCDV